MKVENRGWNSSTTLDRTYWSIFIANDKNFYENMQILDPTHFNNAQKFEFITIGVQWYFGLAYLQICNRKLFNLARFQLLELWKTQVALKLENIWVYFMHRLHNELTRNIPSTICCSTVNVNVKNIIRCNKLVHATNTFPFALFM